MEALGRPHALVVALAGLGVALGNCQGGDSACASSTCPPPGVAAERVADMVHAVVEADRKSYTSQVVNRLVRDQKLMVIHPAGQVARLAASEDWKSQYAALPLPAQMFRMGATEVLEKDLGFSYALLSPWPINQQNRPRTAVETAGLNDVAAAGADARFYRQEELEGRRFLTAVYPDVAVVPACVECHNAHPDSPRRDFKVGDVMGGIVVRIPVP